MSIIDLQRNHKGIQTIVTSLAADAAAGQGAMLQHTNGYIYCVYARNRLDGASKRRLFLTKTNDGGTTWTTPIQVTDEDNSYLWEDDPAIIQLDPTDTGSNIGVVFNRSTAETGVPGIVRIVIDKDTGLPIGESGYEPITGAPTAKKWLSVVHTSTGFMVACLNNTSIVSPTVNLYKNDGAGTPQQQFLSNSWVGSTVSIFTAHYQPMSLSVKRLRIGGASTHLALIAAYRTNLNGTEGAESGGIGMDNLPAGILQCNVLVAFSSDDGSTWSAKQELTSYGGVLQPDLVGVTTAMSADLIELSDGTIVPVFQEALTPQILSPATDSGGDMNIPSGAGNCHRVLYSASKNMLFVAADDATNGGVYVFDLTNQVRYRIYISTSPGPQIHLNQVVNIALTPDENYLAIATSNSTVDFAIDILDISSATFADWDNANHKLIDKHSAAPALPFTVYQMHWDTDNATLFFSYADQSGNGNWGGKFVVGDTSITTLKSDYAFNTQDADFIVGSTHLITHSPAAKAVATKKSDGTFDYSSAVLSGTPIGVAYDDVNHRYIFQTNGSLIQVTDTGSSFTLGTTFNATSTPAVPLENHNSRIEIPGSGIIYRQGSSTTVAAVWYSFGAQKPYGYLAQHAQLALGENFNHTSLFWGNALKSGAWIAMPNNGQAIFLNILEVGRIRYAFYPYDSGAKQLTTAGVDFYDAANSNKVGTNFKSLRFPRIARDDADQLYLYFNRMDLQQSGNEFAPVLGIIEPDVVRISALGRIRNTYSDSVRAKSRIQNSYSHSVIAYVSIHFAQCIKALARIVPRTEVTVSAKASIKNWKYLVTNGSFDVQQTGRTTSLRLQFWANTGYTGLRTVSSLARIEVKSKTRVTGHFIVPANPSGSLKASFGSSANYKQTIGVKARILR